MANVFGVDTNKGEGYIFGTKSPTYVEKSASTNETAKILSANTINESEVISKINKHRQLKLAIGEVERFKKIFESGFVDLDSILSSALGNIGDVGFNGYIYYRYQKTLKKYNLWNVFSDDIKKILLIDYGVNFVSGWIKNKVNKKNNSATNSNNKGISGALGDITELALNQAYKAHENIMNKMIESKKYITEELKAQGLNDVNLDNSNDTIHKIQNGEIKIKPLSSYYRDDQMSKLPKDTIDNINLILAS